MSVQRIREIAEVLQERDYGPYRDAFIQVARLAYPNGFSLLKSIEKIPGNDSSLDEFKVELSDAYKMLLDYMGKKFEGKDSEVRDAFLRRIMEDIMTNGY